MFLRKKLSNIKIALCKRCSGFYFKLLCAYLDGLLSHIFTILVTCVINSHTIGSLWIKYDESNFLKLIKINTIYINFNYYYLYVVLLILIYVSSQVCKMQWDAFNTTCLRLRRVYRMKFNRPLNKETFKIRSTRYPLNTPPAFMYRTGFLVKALSSVEFIRPTLRAWRACFCHIQTY